MMRWNSQNDPGQPWHSSSGNGAGPLPSTWRKWTSMSPSVAAMLRTRFTELFNVTHPVMSAPMALHSGGRLAGAVTAAGGLGAFGGIHPAKGPDWMAAEIATITAATDGPYAVGFITAFLPM